MVQADKSLENTKRATAVFLHGCFVDAAGECLKQILGIWDLLERKQNIRYGYAETVLLQGSLTVHSEKPHRNFSMKNSVKACLHRIFKMPSTMMTE